MNTISRKASFEEVIPPEVAAVMGQLESAGHEAYVVGGCVRDARLGREPHDWDMTTSATPDQMKEAVSYKALDTGLQHGTITFVVDGMPVETTVFRTEGEYSDGRHPDSIAFASTLEEDLARRDFTVNAMAWSPSTGVVDPFGGAADLENNTLRCVGAADERFSEDGLRVMRALRFAAVYGLDIEEETAAAMHRKKGMLDAVSEERISAELVKMMAAPDGQHLAAICDEFSDVVTQAVPELALCLGYDQGNPHHDRDLWHHSLAAMANVPADSNLRLAALFHDSGKPACKTVDKNGTAHFYGHMEEGRKLSVAAMERLKFPRRDIDEVSFLVSQHDNRPASTMKSARKLLAKCGDEKTAKKLLSLMRADATAHAPEAAERVLERLEAFEPFFASALEENTAFKVSDLKIGGRDLIAMGWQPGPEMGSELKRLFSAVMDGSVPNDREALLAAVSAVQTLNGDESLSDQKASENAVGLSFGGDEGMTWVAPHVRGGSKIRGYWRKVR